MKLWIQILTYIIQSFVIINGIASIVVFSQTINIETNTTTISSCMVGDEKRKCTIGLNGYNFAVGVCYLVTGCFGLSFCILYSVFEINAFKIISYIMLVMSLCMMQVWGPLIGGFGILTPQWYTAYWQKYYWSAYVMAMFTAISAIVIFGVLMCSGCMYCIMNINAS